MRKAIVAVVLLILLCFASYAFASYSPRLDGKPSGFEPGKSTGYFIWQDKEGLHLRTTSTESSHKFSGTVTTDGKFENLFGKSAGPDDHFKVNEDRDKITFQFTNSENSSGIDLHVNDGTYVTFNLSWDGEKIDPAEIFIGEDGWHPGSPKFTLRHDEDTEKVNSERTILIVGGPYWWHCPTYWGPGWRYRHWHHW